MLPLSYIKLDYIESTDTQYIDSGIVPNSDITVEINFCTTDYLNARQVFLGIMGSSNNNANMIAITKNENADLHYTMSWGAKVKMSDMDLGDYHTIKMGVENGSVAIYFDGVKSTFGSPTRFSTNSLYMLAGKISTSGSVMGAYAKFRYCKFWNGEILIRDFIPVLRRSDKKPGLYDLVNDVFYTNQGTGEFLYELKYNSRIKVNGAWKDSTAMMKNNGEWKVATPLVKNTTWKQA